MFQVYDRLGVTLIERGESFYQDLMKQTVEFLNQKGFLEEDEGRKVMFAKGLQVNSVINLINVTDSLLRENSKQNWKAHNIVGRVIS